MKLNFDKNNYLNVFIDNKAKSIQCNLQRCIFVYVFWLTKIKGMNIFWCLKKPLATKPKKFVANWPLKRKINLKGSLSINRCCKRHAVIGCLFFSCCKSKNCIKI